MAGARHLALVPDKNTMVYWLAYVCREARAQAEPKLKHVEIAVAARQFAARGAAVDQSTVSRFEKGTTWPRNADVIVAAYADELRRRGHDIEPADLWQEALRLWQAHQAGEALSAADAAAETRQQSADGATTASARRDRRRAG